MFAQKIHLISQKYHALFRFLFILAGWIAGVGVGLIAFHTNKALFLSLVYGATINTASVFVTLFSIIVPFLITGFCLRRNIWFPVYILAFVEAMSYSACSASIFSLYGPAGWLAQLLLLFAQNASVILLFVLWMNWLQRSMQSARLIYTSVFVSLVCAVVNLFLISPICVSVFSF